MNRSVHVVRRNSLGDSATIHWFIVVTRRRAVANVEQPARPEIGRSG